MTHVTHVTHMMQQKAGGNEMQPSGMSPRSPGGALTRPLREIHTGADMDDGKLVIVIDDSPMICRIVEFSLREYAINTISFYNGIDALNAFHDRTVPVPDLVLLDIKMPVMSGYVVAGMLNGNRTFLREGRPVPIVMLSAKDGLFDRIRAKRVGAEDFISKPFERYDLIRKVFPLLGLEIPAEVAATHS
jgi:twitching motility two-component system response regulator PilG